MPEQTPPVAGQDDVDAVAPEPGLLVETVTGAAGKLRLCAYLEDAALRGRSAERQLQLSRFVEREQAEPSDAHRHLQVEPTPTRRCRHDNECCLGASDLQAQGTVIETVEADTPPTPARQRQQAGDRPDGPPGARGQADRDCACERDEHRQADEIRQRDPEAERGEQRVRRREEWSRDHGATRSLSWSSRAGPIPGTASSSSTEVNAPCFCR